MREGLSANESVLTKVITPWQEKDAGAEMKMHIERNRFFSLCAAVARLLVLLPMRNVKVDDYGKNYVVKSHWFDRVLFAASKN
jgi:hypothetical protein